MSITIRGRNFCARDPGPDEIPDATVLIGCNLAQAEPGTPILAGRQGLTLIGCNCARATLPPDARLKDCNTSQRPIPPEPEPTDSVLIEAAELDALLADREELNRLKAEKGLL